MPIIKYILLLLLLSTPLHANQTVSLKEAEKVALNYMRAFYSINLEKAADLTHSETLKAFHINFHSELSKAIHAGEEIQFLSEFGINTSIDELKSMSARALFVYVATSNNMLTPDNERSFIKNTKIEVIGSEYIDPGMASVELLFTNEKGSPQSYPGKLVLRLENNEWKVFSDS